jgi:hypothetical protein
MWATEPSSSRRYRLSRAAEPSDPASLEVDLFATCDVEFIARREAKPSTFVPFLPVAQWVQ